MSFLTENLQALAARGIELPEGPAREKTEALVSRTGQPVLCYGGRLLHSRFDPVREADRVVDALRDRPLSAVFFFGLGLGYLCEAFARRRPTVPMVAVAPDAGLLRAALDLRPLGHLLANPHFRLLVRPTADELSRALETLSLASVEILRNKAVTEPHADLFAALEQTLARGLDRKQVNVNTIARFGTLWVRNLFQNLQRFVSSPGVGALENLFAGVPALVLASGPSLDGVLPHLRPASERALVIAVDTSYRAAVRVGVEPDVLVVIDPQYWNTRHLDGVPLGRTLVLTEGSAHPRAVRAAGDRCLFMSSLFPLGRLFESVGGAKGVLGTGGSVATTAWDLARHLGADPVFMAGLDLGYPDRQTHFRGAFFETRFHTFSNRLETAEQLSFAYLWNAGPYPVPANNGGTVLTDRRMAVYSSWFETQMKQPGGPGRTFNLSPGGVRIPGMPAADIEELLRLPTVRDRVEKCLSSVRGRLPSSLNEPRLVETLEQMRGHLRELATLAEEGVEASHRLRELRARGASLEGTVAQLDHVDGRIQAAGSRDVVSFLMQPIIQTVMETQGADVVDQSERLYREIRRSCELHLQILERSLLRAKEYGHSADSRSGEGTNPNL